MDDVDQFDGHIACSSSTRSELVVPIFDRSAQLFAVLDIDSDQRAFFNKQYAEKLDSLLRNLFTARVEDAIWPE